MRPNSFANPTAMQATLNCFHNKLTVQARGFVFLCDSHCEQFGVNFQSHFQLPERDQRYRFGSTDLIALTSLFVRFKRRKSIANEIR